MRTPQDIRSADYIDAPIRFAQVARAFRQYEISAEALRLALKTHAESAYRFARYTCRDAVVAANLADIPTMPMEREDDQP